MNIELLLKDCKNDKAKAQRTLYDTYFQRLYSIVLRYVAQDYIREELIADSFIKIFQHLNNFQYSNDAMFYAWMKKIVVNECLMHLRKQAITYTEINEDNTAIPDNENPLSQLHVKEIMHHIQRLPNGYRTVFNLFHFENCSHQEIAELLHISEATSKSQLYKAKNILKKQLKRD